MFELFFPRKKIFAPVRTNRWTLLGRLALATLAFGLSKPVSAQTVSRIASPSANQPSVYARNSWDLQAWNGQLLIGSGDSSDNAGRTPIRVFDPASGALTHPFITDDEQVDEFSVVNGRLMVAGHDSVLPSIGKIYARDEASGTWSAWSQMNDCAHIYSLASFGGAMFASGVDWSGRSNVWRSVDNAKTWAPVCGNSYTIQYPGGPITLRGARAWLLLPLRGELFALRLWSAGTPTNECVWKWNGASARFEPVTVAPSDLTPGADLMNEALRWKRPLTLDDGRVLTLGVASVHDHQWKAVALYLVSKIGAGGVQKVALPDGALPYDSLKRGSTVYVLGWVPASKSVRVYALDAANPTNAPREILRFAAPTFARSFEEIGGTFYFGLGCDDDAICANTGELWRATAQPVATPLPVPTATALPVPTATALPVPTATALPLPTATALPLPTATALPLPTATPLPTSTPIPSSTAMPTPVATVSPEESGLSFGLNGSYFPGNSAAGTPVVTRVEGPVAFELAPSAALTGTKLVGNWSASYVGWIEAPITGDVNLWTRTDDGVRLWVSDKLVIDDWTIHPPTWKVVKIPMVLGRRYPIRLNYFQGTGGAVLQFRWNWSGAPLGLVPREYLWH